MRLALVPLIGTGAIDDPIRPNLPPGIQWEQRSSLFQPIGQALITINDIYTLDLARVGVITPLDLIDPDECLRLYSAMRKPHRLSAMLKEYKKDIQMSNTKESKESANNRKWDTLSKIANDRRAYRKEYSELFRTAVTRIEKQWFGDPGPGIFSLTPLHSDNFNRANGSIDGDAMSDAQGVWTVVAGGMQVTSNRCEGNGTQPSAAYDSAMNDENVQRSSVTIHNTNLNGPTARHPASNRGTAYFADSGLFGSNFRLFRWGGGGSFTQLGSNGGAPTVGDILSCDADGDQITHLVDGIVEIGPITDSNYATGKAGLLDYFGNNQGLDDWQVETEISAGHIHRNFTISRVQLRR